MKTWSIGAFLVMTLAALTACPSPGLYQGPANIPDSFETIPVDSAFSMYVFVMDGGRTPQGVSELEASCADSTLCSVFVGAPDAVHRWQSIVILPLATGSTQVEISYLHPGTRELEHRSVSVKIVPAEVIPFVKLGAAAPASASKVNDSHPAEDGSDIPSRCAKLTSGGILAGLVRKDAAIEAYACTESRSYGDQLRRFPLCRGMCTEIARYTLCSEQRDGVIVGLTRYRWNTRTMRYERLDREGAHSAGACELVPRT